jgi:hypothetical protein
MLLSMSSKEIFIINDAMRMIALRIGSSKVAKVRSASLPCLPHHAPAKCGGSRLQVHPEGKPELKEL